MNKTKTQPRNPADVMSQPYAGVTGDHSEVCETIRPGRHRQSQSEFDATERDVQKLRETKRRQFSNGNTN